VTVIPTPVRISTRPNPVTPSSNAASTRPATKRACRRHHEDADERLLVLLDLERASAVQGRGGRAVGEEEPGDEQRGDHRQPGRHEQEQRRALDDGRGEERRERADAALEAPRHRKGQHDDDHHPRDEGRARRHLVEPQVLPQDGRQDTECAPHEHVPRQVGPDDAPRTGSTTGTNAPRPRGRPPRIAARPRHRHDKASATGERRCRGPRPERNRRAENGLPKRQPG
jgi:hypothetical protein